jgi:hypothetical protein
MYLAYWMLVDAQQHVRQIIVNVNSSVDLALNDANMLSTKLRFGSRITASFSVIPSVTLRLKAAIPDVVPTRKLKHNFADHR